MKYRIILLVGMLFIIQNHATAQALHWLSQPESQLGQVQNNDTFSVKSSANGRFLSFVSRASNLVAGDVNQDEDFFVFDSLNGSVQIASLNSSGQQLNDTFIGTTSAPTSDGKWVAFIGYGDFGFGAGTNGFNRYMYLKNLQTGQLQPLSVDENGDLFEVTGLHLADDGSSVMFTTSERLDPLHNDSNTNLYRKDLTDNSYTLISVAEDGLSGANNRINQFAESPNGRYVVISTRATNIMTGTATSSNVFLIDNNTEETLLVTVKPDGTPTAYNSIFTASNLAVSNLGQVAYTTWHDDLVSGDTNEKPDLFLFNGTSNIRINLDNNGDELLNPRASSVLLSADSSRLIFTENNSLLSTDSNNHQDIYSYDVQSTVMTLITETSGGNNPLSSPQNYSEALSADGTRLFISSEFNLSGSVNSSQHLKTFVYDFGSQQISQINPVAFSPNTITENVFVPQVSSDQMSVLYSSEATNLTAVVDTSTTHDLFLLDRQTDSHQKIATNVNVGSHTISPSGRYVAFGSRFFQPAGSIDLGENYVFFYDRLNDQYNQIAVGGSPSVNDAGWVVFSSANNLTANDSNTFADVYLFEPDGASLSLVSENNAGVAGNESSYRAKISGSAFNSWITFSSSATDLVSADLNQSRDVFMRSWPAGSVIRVSQTPTLEGGNDYSDIADISYDGDTISFLSLATNLTADDYSNHDFLFQGFVYDRNTQLVKLYSFDSNGLVASSGVDAASLSDSGRYIAYSTGEPVLPEDTDIETDIYLYDQILESTVLISKKTNNQQSADYFRFPDVVEDLMVSPTLVGVAFSGQGFLTSVAEHPGYDEAFLYQQGGPDVDLSIQINGLGSINGSLGISCISNCDYSYSLGTELSMIATPTAGYQFDRWQSSHGQCTDNSNPCNLTMNRDKQITAIFIDENDIIFAAGFE